MLEEPHRTRNLFAAFRSLDGRSGFITREDLFEIDEIKALGASGPDGAAEMFRLVDEAMTQFGATGSRAFPSQTFSPE